MHLIFFPLIMSMTSALILAGWKSWPDFVEFMSFYQLLAILPYFVSALISVIGLWFKQGRIFVSGVFILCLFILFQSDELGGTFLYKAQIAAIAMPLSFLVIAIRETRIFSLQTGLKLFFVALPFVALMTISKTNPLFFQWIIRWKLFGLSFWKLSEASLLSYVFSTIALYFVFSHRFKHLLYATVISTTYFLFAINFLQVKNLNALVIAHALPLLFMTISLNFIILILTVFWRRVFIDDLTEVPNRRAFNDHLLTLHNHFVIAVIDIDHFKRFNDDFGHQEGDNVLRLVARHLNRFFPRKVFRFGGEEFCIVIQGQEIDLIKKKLDEMRASLYERDFFIRAPKIVRESSSWMDRGLSHKKKKKVKISISLGVAGATSSKEEPEVVLRKADQALYRAKEQGRNRIISAS